MRIIDSPDLFGGGCGSSTLGTVRCDICGASHNEGADEKEDYSDSVSVGDAWFGDMYVLDCCFEKIENAVLQRMPDILKWYKKILETRKADNESNESLLNDVCGREKPEGW